MKAFKTGKEQKFIAVYHSYVDEVYRFIYARSGFDAALAEDVTQDIFLDVFKGLDRFKGFSSERTWIFRIAQNKLNDFYRRQYRRGESLVIDDAAQLADFEQTPEKLTEKIFERRLVQACLDCLPLHYRMLLLMKYGDGKSVKEIAAMIGKTAKATESMLQRAKGAFRKEYECREEEEHCHEEK